MLFGFIGTTEIVIILVIALLVFGPQKIPEISRQIGSAYRELNRMRGEVSRALEFESYVQPYDMPPYESAPGTYPQDTYNSGYDYNPEGEYSSLHPTLAVPPPGPTIGPTVTEVIGETIADGDSDTLGTGKVSEIGPPAETTDDAKVEANRS